MGSLKSVVIVLAAVGILGLFLMAWYSGSGADTADSLASENPAVQEKAVANLSASADTSRGLERISEAIANRDPVVACGALRALAASTGPDKPLPAEGVKVAEDATRDSRPEVRLTAIQVLEVTTPPLPEDKTVPAIMLETFNDANTPQLRAAAASALGKFQYWEAMESLINAMEDESVEVRSAAGMAVRQILGLDYGFRANAPLSDRQAVMVRLRREWRSSKLYHEKYAKRVQDARKAGNESQE